jgi:hypothetical protein
MIMMIIIIIWPTWAEGALFRGARCIRQPHIFSHSVYGRSNIIIIIMIIIIMIIIIINMLMPVKHNSFTHLRVLSVLTARGSNYTWE